MRLASFLCVAIVLITQANAQGEKETIEKVQTGIAAANDILGILESGGNSQNFVKISQIAGKLTPFLGAIGPVISIISVFLPDSPSPELLLMKKEFAKIDAKFDQVFYKFDQLRNLILEASLKSQYGDYANTILSLSNKLHLYFNRSYEHADAFKNIFIKEYESTYGGATWKLYNGMMKESTLSDNIPLTAMKYTNDHRRKTQDIMKGVVTLIMQGVKVVIAYHKLKDDEAGYNAMKSYWEDELKKLLNHVIYKDITVKYRWYSRLNSDMDEMLAKHHGKSNRAFANELYSFLNEKFDWRLWHVVAYNEIKGGSRHWLKACDGYHKFRRHGRNLVVSSFDNDKTPSSMGYASAEFQWVSKDKCWRNWLGHTQCVGAHEMYDALPIKLRDGCEYAAVGVIEKGADISHKAPRNRYRIHTNTHYKLHAFG